ncbi:hypothetical protein ENUP19_0080G0009 [Entamoeba nuttalli]|uniref:Uncharacterized protein n=1 Tax=Entamoeba nuttalli TaxID=412467 RepID=A0ABQ0DFB6_9EUKA
MLSKNTLFKTALFSRKKVSRVSTDLLHFDHNVAGYLIKHIFKDIFTSVEGYNANRSFNGEGFLKNCQRIEGSRSPVTQIIGSIANAVVLLACLDMLNISVRDYMILGDDALIISDQLLNIKSVKGLESLPMMNVHFVLSPDKYKIHHNDKIVEFIGYEFSNGKHITKIFKLDTRCTLMDRLMSLEQSASRITAQYLVG